MFEDNPYFSAGFGLALLGVGYRALAQGTKLARILFYKRYLISLEVTNSDPSFRWVLSFVQNNRGVMANHITAQTLGVRSNKPFVMTPSPGSHVMRYKNRFFLVERSRETTAINLATGAPFESVKFTTFGSNRRILEALFADSLAEGNRIANDRTVVYKSKAYTWDQFGHPRQKRPIDSIILAGSLKQEILGDFAQFNKASGWYRSKGVPYRRTYLFHGPPGSGKTSFITGHFNLNISLMSLTESITDDQFAQAMSCVPEGSIIVMEDIDAVFHQRKTAADGYRHGISFSGLLNVLDGVVSSEERIVFLTTNHLDRLDPALIRPGRVDVTKFFGNADARQAEEMYLKFFEGETDVARRFSQAAQGRSMADIQGVLMEHKGSSKRALEAVICRSDAFKNDLNASKR